MRANQPNEQYRFASGDALSSRLLLATGRLALEATSSFSCLKW